MKLRSHLQLGFTFLVALVLASGGFSLYAFQQTQTAHKLEAPEDWDQALQILKCERALMEWDHSLRRLAGPLSPKSFASHLQVMQSRRTGLLDCLQRLASEAAHSAYLQAANDHFEGLEKASHHVVEQARSQQFDQARDHVVKRWEPSQILLHQDLLGLVLSYRSETQAQHQSTADHIEQQRERVAIVVALAVLLTLFVAWRTGRKVGGRLLWMSDGLSTLLGEEVEASDSPQSVRRTVAAGAHRLPIVTSLLNSLQGAYLLFERGYFVAGNAEAVQYLGPLEPGQSLTELLVRKGFSPDAADRFLEDGADLELKTGTEHLIFGLQSIVDDVYLVNCVDASLMTALRGRQQAVVQALPSAIVDDDLRIQATGKPLAKLLASDDPESLIGQALADLFPLDQGNPFPVEKTTEDARDWSGLLACQDDRSLQAALISLGPGKGSIFLAQEVTQTVREKHVFADESRTLRQQLEVTEKSLNELQARQVEFDRDRKAHHQLIVGLNKEVRGPLHSVIGLGQLLTDHANNPAQLKETALQLQGQAQRIMETIYDVQDLAHLEANVLDFNQRPIHLQTLLGAMVELHNNDARKKGLELNGDAIVPEDLHVLVDDLRLRQMVNCLLRRSIFYTEAGIVSLRGEATRSEGNWLVRVEVSDSGPAIPEDEKETPFGLLGSRSKPGADRWCGIDLKALRLLAQAMGGDAFATDQGTGITRFGFTIVVEEAGIQQVTPPTLDVPAPQAGEAVLARVLVVEDDPVNQVVAKAMLEKMGFSVELVATGQELSERLQALKEGREVEVDMVLMDVMLASESGLDLTRKIRAWEAGANSSSRLPILAVTAQTEAEDRQACLDAGMDGFISKPYRADELHGTIESLLRAGEAV